MLAGSQGVITDEAGDGSEVEFGGVTLASYWQGFARLNKIVLLLANIKKMIEMCYSSHI